MSHLKNRITRPDLVGACTPWGPSQSAMQYAPGLIFHSTAGHGGFEVSPARWAVLVARFGDFQSYAGHGFLEEDCDWAIAALAFPDFFTDHEIFCAFEAMKSYQPAVYAAAKDATPGGAWMRAEAYYAANKDKFRLGSISGGGRKPGYRCSAWTYDGEQRLIFDLDRYPQLPPAFTLDDLAAAGARILEPLAKAA